MKSSLTILSVGELFIMFYSKIRKRNMNKKEYKAPEIELIKLAAAKFLCGSNGEMPDPNDPPSF